MCDIYTDACKSMYRFERVNLRECGMYSVLVDTRSLKS